MNNLDGLRSVVTETSCKTEIDSLINERIYITADIPPQNAGGKNALLQQLNKIAKFKMTF